MTRQRTGLLAGPIVFVLMLLLPAPAALAPEAWRVAAVAVLMVVWWISEALPIPATALVPVVLFPVLGIADIEAATRPYANPLIFLFLGGFIIAQAMQRSGLHRRIALSIVGVVGTRPTAIVLGFMIAAAFLSMWVSNTATAMMMLPIAVSIIKLVETDETMQAGGLQSNFALVMLLGLAYACNIGGMGTLIGTPPNALMAAFVRDNYDIEIGFGQWMLIGVPLVAVSLPLVFLMLVRVLFPIRLKRLPGGARVIRDELEKAGAMSRDEKLVASVFGLTAALWMTRPLLEPLLPGLSDAGIAIFGALLMFLLPVDFRKLRFVLAWSDAKKLPWGVLILFGGGLSLASGITDSGLADWIGGSFRALEGLHIAALILLAASGVILLTEVTSNTATAAAFLPILASVAIGMGLDPLVLAVPAAFAASCAFMLPVATPPNAIVFGSGLISIPEMARAGILVNLVMVFIITAAMFLLMGWVFGVGAASGGAG
ncbi:MAG: DASS family sodium-coupled anion symporter [Wenzhouxiangellaceae bacterium]|nr:DASS family sodium-coupled anion symporter [Wenzhouxiangellaceae bacterium]